MYGRVLGVSNVAIGVSLYPSTKHSSILFIVASSILVAGVAIFVASELVARKSRGN